MNLADMDIEVATRILVLQAEAAVAHAEAEMLARVEAFRHDPKEESARAAIEAHDAWTHSRVALAQAESAQHLSALIEEMENMQELDTWTEAFLRQVAHDRLDMSKLDDEAAQGEES